MTSDQTKQTPRKQAPVDADHIIEAAPAMILSLSADGEVEFANPHVRTISGWTPEALRGQRFVDCCVPDAERSRVEQTIKDARDGRSVAGFVHALTTQDGRTLSIEWTYFMARTGDGDARSMICVGVDVTEQLEREAALKDEQHRVRAMIDSTFAFVCMFDREGRVTEINNAPLEAAGLERDAVIGHLFWDAPWWAHSRGAAGKIRTALERAAAGATVRQTCFAQFRNGQVAPVDCIFSPYRDRSGRIAGIVGTGLDMTEQSKVERELLRERERLAQAQRIAHIGSWELDHKTGELSWSDEVYAMFGIRKTDLDPSYEGFLKHVHPEDREQVDTAYSQSIQNRHPYEIVHRVQPEGRATIWVREQCETEFEGAEPVLSRGTVQDITDQHLAGARLTASQATLSSILSASPEALIIISSDYKIVMFSEGAEKMFRCAGDAVIGKHFDCLMPERLRSAHKRHVERFERENLSQLRMSERAEITGLRADGEEFAAEASVSKSAAADGHVYAIIMRDMTSRRTFETALKTAKDRAEGANRAKSAFLATMSHEIRTPLNGLLGILSVLQKSALSEEQKKMVSIATDSGWSLLHILNDVLDYSKLEADEFVLERTDFDPRQIIERVIALHRPNAEHKALQMDVSIADSVPLSLTGDPTRFERVLHNLLSNAIKFTPEGRISVVASGVPQADGSNHVQLAVEDTGIGMTEEQCELIFDRFIQADSTTTRRFGGTGLGLAIVDGLVQRMGGQVTVSSRLGEGSRFTVEIPCTPVDPEAASDDRIVDLRTTPLSGRVLIVEDNLLNAEALDYMLSDFGLETQVAYSGREAIEAYASETFDLVLMDIQMPEMDGETAMREIRRIEQETGSDPTRIIACSAFVHDGREAHYLDAGFDEVMAKPIAPENLQRIVFGDLAASASSR